MVTHERDFALFAKRIVEMRDGKVIKDFIIKDRLDANKEYEKMKLESASDEN
jgi:ABC-type lipoprotein export system ATPase subunit